MGGRRSLRDRNHRENEVGFASVHDPQELICRARHVARAYAERVGDQAAKSGGESSSISGGVHIPEGEEVTGDADHYVTALLDLAHLCFGGVVVNYFVGLAPRGYTRGSTCEQQNDKYKPRRHRQTAHLLTRYR
jgi:hypothetical protein